jgi:hypothetical protein
MCAGHIGVDSSLHIRECSKSDLWRFGGLMPVLHYNRNYDCVRDYLWVWVAFTRSRMTNSMKSKLEFVRYNTIHCATSTSGNSSSVSSSAPSNCALFGTDLQKVSIRRHVPMSRVSKMASTPGPLGEAQESPRHHSASSSGSSMCANGAVGHGRPIVDGSMQSKPAVRNPE